MFSLNELYPLSYAACRPSTITFSMPGRSSTQIYSCSTLQSARITCVSWYCYTAYSILYAEGD